ncbi:MAG: restriction endonuclease [Desulfuromonadaceae bacterium]|nr:restriction endonuclease [Desulfuromonadaceae bacterium]MDD2847363.1 restriction endonuclease [Desulfuromonadaceae bacterium]MDD4131524.1 restriction endonuclease [Desulfuromonadaceae bacterium]
MITDWKKLSPALFEKLCAAVLGKIGFVNIQWFGEAGSDKGRDIIAERTDCPVPGVERRERWMIQCKRYTQTKLSKSELKELLDSALEHTIDSLLIIVTTSVSANLRDWFSSASENYPFKTYIWEEIDFRKQVIKQKSELLETIPELSAGRDPLWLYQRDNIEIHLGCNEFEGVEIVVFNAEDIDEAKARASEFIRYLQANGFEWWD